MVNSSARQAMPAALISGAPKIFESLLAQLRVTGSVLDGSMAEPVLNCPRVALRETYAQTLLATGKIS